MLVITLDKPIVAFFFKKYTLGIVALQNIEMILNICFRSSLEPLSLPLKSIFQGTCFKWTCSSILGSILLFKKVYSSL